MNISKSTGLDGIPARFIKDAAEVIKGPITYIVNLSLRCPGSCPTPRPPPSQLRHCRGVFFLLLMTKRFWMKKRSRNPYWTWFFFPLAKFRSPNEISFTIVILIRGTQEAIPIPTPSLANYATVRAHFNFKKMIFFYFLTGRHCVTPKEHLN